MTTDALFHAFLADLTANDVPPAKAAVTARHQSNVATAFAGVVARLIREQMDEALAPLVAEAAAMRAEGESLSETLDSVTTRDWRGDPVLRT